METEFGSNKKVTPGAPLTHFPGRGRGTQVTSLFEPRISNSNLVVNNTDSCWKLGMQPCPFCFCNSKIVPTNIQHATHRLFSIRTRNIPKNDPPLQKQNHLGYIPIENTICIDKKYNPFGRHPIVNQKSIKKRIHKVENATIGTRCAG